MPAEQIANAASQGVSGLISTIIGASQKKQGKKLLKGLTFPEETIPEEVIQNQNKANQMAATGLPSEQYNRAMRDIQRQQLTALRYAGNRRGALMALPAITQGTNDANLNLNAADAQQKIANQKTAMDVNNNVANWKTRLFDVNKRRKYDRDYEYAMSLLGMGNQNLVGGIDRIGAAGSSLIGMGGGNGGNMNASAAALGGY